MTTFLLCSYKESFFNASALKNCISDDWISFTEILVSMQFTILSYRITNEDTSYYRSKFVDKKNDVDHRYFSYYLLYLTINLVESYVKNLSSS